MRNIMLANSKLPKNFEIKAITIITYLKNLLLTLFKKKMPKKL